MFSNWMTSSSTPLLVDGALADYGLFMSGLLKLVGIVGWYEVLSARGCGSCCEKDDRYW